MECILSKENLGYGAGNNLGLSKVETSYALIVNPDVTLNNDALNKFFLSIDNLGDFGIIATISQNEKYNNLDCNIESIVNSGNDSTVRYVVYIEFLKTKIAVKKENKSR